MRRGLYLAPFDELADPRVLADLASDAEAHGWDGLFLWDRIAYPPRGRAVADAWVALSAIASVTAGANGIDQLPRALYSPRG
jgi:alkanesulfonate monooxygenase SsuD/methylene tetrahydromethanopterin reductase-like flavin-dependent oxidoreductase (luciferase family)